MKIGIIGTSRITNDHIKVLKSLKRKNRLQALPITAPKCTRGPYWPTEAPPEADKNAANVEANPVLTLSSLSGR